MTNWTWRTIKQVAEVRLGKMVQPNQVNDTDIEAQYLRAAHIQPEGRLIEVDDKAMWFGPSELRGLDLLAGDVVVVEGGAGFGRSAYLQESLDGWGFQNSIVRVRPKPTLSDGRFLNYVFQTLLSSGRTELEASVATIPHYTAEKVASTRHPMPPVEIQTAIADFLDRETAQIDAMIEAQTRLLEGLNERRLAGLRAHVTGRSREGSKRPSGEAWVGDIPSHWEVRPIRTLFATIGSGTTPPNEALLDEDEDAVQWVTTSELRERVIRRTNQTVSKETLMGTPALRLYDPGTLLIAMYGATIGRLGWLDVQACTNQACCALAKPQGVLPGFAYFALWAAREHLILLGAGGGQPNLNQRKLRALRIPVPPLDEQREITARIEAEDAGIGNVVDAAQQVIDLLRERREALITAAVTGRIDPHTGIERLEDAS